MKPMPGEFKWEGKFPVLLSMEPKQEQLDLMFKHHDAVADLRLFMKTVYADEEEAEANEAEGGWAETNFMDFNFGYLVAKGVPVKEAERLVPFIRYNLQDFDLDPEISPKAQPRKHKDA